MEMVLLLGGPIGSSACHCVAIVAIIGVRALSEDAALATFEGMADPKNSRANSAASSTRRRQPCARARSIIAVQSSDGWEPRNAATSQAHLMFHHISFPPWIARASSVSSGASVSIGPIVQNRPTRPGHKSRRNRCPVPSSSASIAYAVRHRSRALAEQNFLSLDALDGGNLRLCQNLSRLKPRRSRIAVAAVISELRMRKSRSRKTRSPRSP